MLRMLLFFTHDAIREDLRAASSLKDTHHPISTGSCSYSEYGFGFIDHVALGSSTT